MKIHKRKKKSRITLSKKLFYLSRCRTILTYEIRFMELIGCRKKFDEVNRKP